VRGRTPLRRALLLGLAVALAGCAPSRVILAGPEGEQAERFFARLPEGAAFPVKASFSGIAHPAGRDAMPFIAGVNAPAPTAETLGLYDPMGGAVAFLSNDGRILELSRGPMADLAGSWKAGKMPAEALSLGRILSGAPAYPVSGGEAARGGDGAWVLTDERQTLYSDPGRRFLARAEYRIHGVKATVEYPDRLSADPPARIEAAVRGMKISLRRDPD
jgi:hypothetical protein